METLQEYIEAKRPGQQITSATRMETLFLIQETHALIHDKPVASLDIDNLWATGSKASMVKAKRLYCLFTMLVHMSEDESDLFAKGMKMKSTSHIIFRIATPAEDGTTRIECVFRRHSNKNISGYRSRSR